MNLRKLSSILLGMAIVGSLFNCAESALPNGPGDISSSSDGQLTSSGFLGSSSNPVDGGSSTTGSSYTGSSETAQSGGSSLTGTSSSNGIALPLGNAPSVSILPWNGAKGAYSIIMDDFCLATTTSLRWADSAAYARNMSIGFAIVTGSCQATDWATAKIMLGHGSEPVNHSFSHAAGATPVGLEVDSSTHMIETNTGFRPTFFGYPMDEGSDAAQAELKALGYLGSRSTTYTVWTDARFNKVAGFNGFTLAYEPKSSPTYPQLSYADSAVARGVWGLHESHGVADNSYNQWTSHAEFETHLDHLAALRDKGDLWVAPPSKVIRYIKLSTLATWTLVQATGAFEIHWTTPADTLARYSVPLRLQVCGEWTATQSGTSLNATLSGGQTKISANPSLGTVRITPTGAGNSLCTNNSGSSSSSTATSSGSAGGGAISITGSLQHLVAGTYSATTSCTGMVNLQGTRDINVSINGSPNIGLDYLAVPVPGPSFNLVVTGDVTVSCY